MSKDLEQLRLLSIGYYIYGGLSAVFYLMPLLFIFVGIGIVTEFIKPQGKEPPTSADGWTFLIIGTLFFLYGQITSIATILAGRFIKQRKKHLFCLIVAGFNCISFPIGTALGVFTFVVLLRDSVKAMFNRQNLQSNDSTLVGNK